MKQLLLVTSRCILMQEPTVLMHACSLCKRSIVGSCSILCAGLYHRDLVTNARTLRALNSEHKLQVIHLFREPHRDKGSLRLTCTVSPCCTLAAAAAPCSRPKRTSNSLHALNPMELQDITADMHEAIRPCSTVLQRWLHALQDAVASG